MTYLLLELFFTLCAPCAGELLSVICQFLAGFRQWEMVRDGRTERKGHPRIFLLSLPQAGST
jgi:hypothetical protein